MRRVIHAAVVLPLLTPGAALAAEGRIYLTNRVGDRTHIYSVAADGSQLTRLTPLRKYDYQALVSPDGAKVAFVRFTGDRQQLMVMRASGRKTHKVSKDLNVVLFSWSPDSETLVFDTLSSLGEYDLWTVEADGGGPEPLAAEPSVDESSASWSPDGGEIAFIRDGDLVALDVATREQHTIVEGAEVTRTPAWSPDGSLIAFTSTRDDPYRPPDFEGPYTSEIYVVDRTGGGLRNVSDNPDSSDGQAQWTPDSETIVYASSYDDDIAYGKGYDVDVFSVRFDGSERHDLTGDNRIDDWDPVLSPSGRWIVFTRETNRQLGTFKMRIDGSGKRRILQPAEYNYRAESWAPAL